MDCETNGHEGGGGVGGVSEGLGAVGGGGGGGGRGQYRSSHHTSPMHVLPLKYVSPHSSPNKLPARSASRLLLKRR